MREIKFRAWDQDLNKLLNDEDLESYFSGISYGELFIAKYDDRGNWIEAKIMQYTGLKDRANQEIYEGDIVSYPVVLTPTRKDHYKHGLVKWGDIHCWMIGDEMLGEYSSEELEVIGNIYENPELLGGK